MRETTRPTLVREPIRVDVYGGKWIAIWRRRIIDADADFDQLIDRLEKRGLDEKAALMRVPRSGMFIG